MKTLEEKKRANRRLKIVKWQIEWLIKIIETEEKGCVEQVHLITAIEKAMKWVKQIVLRSYIETCATEAIKSWNKKDWAVIYDELMNIISKY